MALFSISDLHLSFGADKPMDVFGKKWENYEEKLKNNWNNLVSKDDVVIVNGDNSWSTYLEDTFEDFDFINKLNGTKIILKGNHDYWWTTMSKHRKWCEQNGFDTLNFLHNNYYMYNDTAICGTRGWQLTSRDEDDVKVHNRELERLKISLDLASKENPGNIIVALHYPPDEDFCRLIEGYNVNMCLFGHLHSAGFKDYRDYEENGIAYKLVSCDYLEFIPYKITS